MKIKESKVSQNKENSTKRNIISRIRYEDNFLIIPEMKFGSKYLWFLVNTIIHILSAELTMLGYQTTLPLSDIYFSLMITTIAIIFSK